MDIVLKSVSSSNEETVIAKNVDISSKKFTWDLDYSVKSGAYNLIFKEKKNNAVYLSTSPQIMILALNENDKNYYPKLIKFTYPYAPCNVY